MARTPRDAVWEYRSWTDIQGTCQWHTDDLRSVSGGRGGGRGREGGGGNEEGGGRGTQKGFGDGWICQLSLAQLGSAPFFKDFIY